MKKQVFISYASKELTKAEEVCNYLEDNGISCWIASRNILPGTEYGEAIINGIENCKVLVLIYSKTSNSSQHVLREVERAVSKRVPLIAYKIEDAQLSKSMEYFLLSNQWLDATTKGNHLNELLRCIQQIVGESNENVEETEIHSKKTDQVVKRLIPTICATVGVIALIVVLSIVLKDTGDDSDDNTATVETSPTATIIEEETVTITPTIVTIENQLKEEKETVITEDDEDDQTKKLTSEETSNHIVSAASKDETEQEIPQEIPNLTTEDNTQQQAIIPDNSSKKNEMINPVESTKEESNVNLEIGEYISFGHYKPQGCKDVNSDSVINWIVVDVNQDKNEVVLITENVLDMKPFDTSESGEADQDGKGNSYDRSKQDSYSFYDMVQFRGNSDWETSNIRTWLNSNAARVSYNDQAPISKATDEHTNSYDKQPGFLNGFSKAEINLLCDVKNITTVNAIDAEKADKPVYEHKAGLISENYNMSKYASKTTTDKVYLLSLDEVQKYLYNNNLQIFANPTQSAVDSDTSSYYKTFLDYGTTYCNWATRTPNGTESNSVVVVGPGVSSKQDFITYNANASGLGIRPAVTISLNGVTVSGDGTQESPYTLK